MMNNHNPQSFTSVELSHEEQHGAKLTFKTDKLIRQFGNIHQTKMLCLYT